MRIRTFDDFYDRLRETARIPPQEAQFELTYRCNLRCGHCYVQGLEPGARELTAAGAKGVLDRLRRLGVFWLSFTGGEPLWRKDFLEIYAYARKKGFLVTIFSNGLLWSGALISALQKSPPYSIEITVNGATAKTYEAITGMPGSFAQLQEKMGALARSGLPVVIKTNAMRPNQAEVPAIKKWAEHSLGRPRSKHRFKYDTFIYPRLNGDRSPLAWRLSCAEVRAMVSRDKDMLSQYEEDLAGCFPSLERPRDRLYQCSSWRERMFINPAGQARFCMFSGAFQFDARGGSRLGVGQEVFGEIEEKKFKTRSKCRTCSLRPVCAWCPAKAKLETGREESPVAHYCRIARQVARLTRQARRARARA